MPIIITFVADYLEYVFMKRLCTVAALFDFDGVVMDTEPQYTVFWNEQGLKYLGVENFGATIKGQTLNQIYEANFTGDLVEMRQQITNDLNLFEKQMTYEYLPGVQHYLKELREKGVGIALVTSSNVEKMDNIYNAYPDFKNQFDHILTGEMFQNSKPHPECFLLGMKLLGAEPENSYVFEDSFHGLQAGRASGATVIGLATTNSRGAIASKADYVIDDFIDMTALEDIANTKKIR